MLKRLSRIDPDRRHSLPVRLLIATLPLLLVALLYVGVMYARRKAG